MKPTVIIAEAGVNHNGDIRLAKKLINIAVKAGADFIKFQAFKADLLTTEEVEKAEYQKKTSGSSKTQHEMLKDLELTFEDFELLKEFSQKKNIGFMVSAFDLESLAFINTLNPEYIKVPSGEITNIPYLRAVGMLRRKVILSTGMSTLKEIKIAVDCLLESGIKKNNLIILHCNTEYPTPIEDVNLKAMISIADEFSCRVGYSDHTNINEVSISAVALGATVIEKHITIDRNLEGPDHLASMEPEDFKNFVDSIRKTEVLLGSKIKKPSASERKNLQHARKVIVAGKSIKKGEVLSSINLTLKRAGNGLSPIIWDSVIGKIAIKDFNKNQIIKLK
tara:strand:+ start:11023 stop:12030 length:1008 start_codon:yes stop_codon:yes gene_type:complete